MKRLWIALALVVGLVGGYTAHASTVQNLDYTVLGAQLDFNTNTITVNVVFTDADDTAPAGVNSYTMAATGPILDQAKRVVAASTPANVLSSANTFKTNVLAAVAAGVAAGKVKPAR